MSLLNTASLSDRVYINKLQNKGFKKAKNNERNYKKVSTRAV